MIHRRFRIQVFVRIVLLGATLMGVAWLGVIAGRTLPAVVLGSIALYQGVLFVHYVEKTNRDLSRLLRSIRYSDFSQAFASGGRGGTFYELADAFREVMNDFRLARSEKEEGYRYLETVMQHVGIGLVSFSADGSVNLVNAAAKRLLRLTHLKNVGALRSLSPELTDTLLGMPYGSKALVRVLHRDEELQLSLHATGFKLRDETMKLVSIQDIGGELAEMEAAAWQKLTRVLTHEIMNSVAPISSLAATAAGLLDDASADRRESSDFADTIEDVHGAVRTIARRSENLLRFVQDYRRLTRVPPPELSIVPVGDLFSGIETLFQTELDEHRVRLMRTVIPETLQLSADRELIEQILINLVRNALDALRSRPDPLLQLRAYIDGRSRAVIEVVDNGEGIVAEALDTIFVPFFTTKKEGSGIGLSLSREIMRLHGGSITAQSEPGVETVIRLRF